MVNFFMVLEITALISKGLAFGRMIKLLSADHDGVENIYAGSCIIIAKFFAVKIFSYYKIDYESTNGHTYAHRSIGKKQLVQK